jgi:hypothetical protein
MFLHNARLNRNVVALWSPWILSAQLRKSLFLKCFSNLLNPNSGIKYPLCFISFFHYCSQILFHGLIRNKSRCLNLILNESSKIKGIYSTASSSDFIASGSSEYFIFIDNGLEINKIDTFAVAVQLLLVILSNLHCQQTLQQ